MLQTCLFLTGYVTRFLFALCSYEDPCKDDDYDNHDMQPLERRLCDFEGLHTSDNCEFCPHLLCSSSHKQSSENDSDSCDSRKRHAVKHVYDDDGDLVVKRKFHQECEIIYIG